MDVSALVPPDWHNKPNVARIYDYLLGGLNNFDVDRETAERMLALDPNFREYALANRLFLGRVVRALAAAGVTQFLDIGSGLPTVGNVHTIAQDLNRSARVVYVDSDPIAVLHAQNLLAVEGVDRQVAAVQGDIREPQAILRDPAVREILDFERPIAILCFLVLHFVTDDERVYGVIRELSDALAPGSYLALSHADDQEAEDDQARELKSQYAAAVNTMRSRTRAEVAGFFEGFDLLDPGVVFVPAWRPDDADPERPDPFRSTPQRVPIVGAVGRKR